MLVSHFEKRPHWSDIHNEDIIRSLSPLERSLCEKFDLVIIPGKRSPVPVIIPPCILSAIELLLSCRESLNISSKYIFANPDSKKVELLPLRSWDLITKHSLDANLQNPDVMTSTNFRKYTATVAQIVNLNENELEWLCKHMGHNMAVHKEFYRFPSAALEIAKVSKILIAAEEGEIHKHAGESLQTMDIAGTASDLLGGTLNNGQETMDAEDANSSADVPENNALTDIAEESPSYLPPSNLSQSNLSSGNIQQSNVTSTENGASQLSPSSKSLNKRYIWDKMKKAAALEHFKEFVQKKKSPGKKECVQYIRSIGLSIEWTTLKNLVKNSYYQKNSS